MDCKGQNAINNYQVQIPWIYKLPDKIKQLAIATQKECGETQERADL